jgi:hypothetical protein
MKRKFLLGTTALVAAGFITGGAAQAEEPITAGISGYFKSAMGLVSQDDGDGELQDNSSSMVLGNNTAINITGSTTLDNGITIGFSSQIEGNTNATAGSATLDERFVFFRGSFGTLQVGQKEGARADLTNFTPGAASNFGVNTPFFLFGGGGTLVNISTYNDGIDNDDAIKAIYFSPTFNGFRLAASYAPSNINNGQYGGNVTNVAGGIQNNASAGADFSKDFGDFNLRVMGAWEGYVVENCGATANLQACENNPDSLQFGGTVSMGSFAVGFSWLETEQVAHDNNGNGRDRETWHAGAAWNEGPFGVALEYGTSDIDAADLTSDELEMIELNTHYVLGPGIDVQAAVTMGDFDEGTPNGLSNDWTTFKIGSSIGF